jgi:chemotaxis protein CheZ
MSGQSFKREQVVNIIGSVINKMSASAHPVDDALFEELTALKTAIDALREELNLARPGEIQAHIPKATDELDAIIATTASATDTIMSGCEKVQALLKDVPGPAAKQIESEVMCIVEACTFQDLTGQRITKIIKSLKEIDTKTLDLMRILEDRFATVTKGKPVEKQISVNDKDSLLNGPQLPGQGISQEEIDKLLSDFN